jgi:hypothetical protein
MLIKVRFRGSTVGQANAYFRLYTIYPTHTPPHPNQLRSLIANIALGSITPNLAYIVVTKSLQHHNGLVVLANANKSTVLRVHGWPGKHLFSALTNLPRTHTPSPKLAALANCKYCTGMYYTKSSLYRGNTGNESQSR